MDVDLGFVCCFVWCVLSPLRFSLLYLDPAEVVFQKFSEFVSVNLLL
jgi:hypothetical protein